MVVLFYLLQLLFDNHLRAFRPVFLLLILESLHFVQSLLVKLNLVIPPLLALNLRIPVVFFLDPDLNVLFLYEQLFLSPDRVIPMIMILLLMLLQTYVFLINHPMLLFLQLFYPSYLGFPHNYHLLEFFKVINQILSWLFREFSAFHFFLSLHLTPLFLLHVIYVIFLLILETFVFFEHVNSLLNLGLVTFL